MRLGRIFQRSAFLHRVLHCTLQVESQLATKVCFVRPGKHGLCRVKRHSSVEFESNTWRPRIVSAASGIWTQLKALAASEFGRSGRYSLLCWPPDLQYGPLQCDFQIHCVRILRHWKGGTRLPLQLLYVAANGARMWLLRHLGACVGVPGVSSTTSSIQIRISSWTSEKL